MSSLTSGGHSKRTGGHKKVSGLDIRGLEGCTFLKTLCPLPVDKKVVAIRYVRQKKGFFVHLRDKNTSHLHKKPFLALLNILCMF
jgi:hypothetical protein